MTLDIDDFDRFRRFHTALMSFVNDTLDIFPNDDHPNIYLQLCFEERFEIHSAFAENTSALTRAYIKENPQGLTRDELDEIRPWGTAAISGEFVAFRQLKRHAIFIPAEGKATAFGVLGLTQPISEMVPMPAFVRTTLFPFQGQIVTDGLMQDTGRVTRHGKAQFNTFYKQAKAGPGVLVALPGPPHRSLCNDPPRAPQREARPLQHTVPLQRERPG